MDSSFDLILFQCMLALLSKTVHLQGAFCVLLLLRECIHHFSSYTFQKTSRLLSLTEFLIDAQSHSVDQDAIYMQVPNKDQMNFNQGDQMLFPQESATSPLQKRPSSSETLEELQENWIIVRTPPQPEPLPI